MKDVKHDLIVTFECPNCGKRRAIQAMTILNKFSCCCGTTIHILKHPNGRVTVLYDPKQTEAK